MSRRSWLFVPGADTQAHRAAAGSGADVIILELEDFTPPQLRRRARELSAAAFAPWRRHGALLLASEDMVADLGTERSRSGEELAYARARFLLECRAAGVEAIDCPYTFSDARGAAADARRAKRLGYRMKSLVEPQHAAAINKALTPDLARALKIVAAFEAARARGAERATLGGLRVEVPIYAAAKRVLGSAERTQRPRRRTRG